MYLAPLTLYQSIILIVLKSVSGYYFVKVNMGILELYSVGAYLAVVIQGSTWGMLKQKNVFMDIAQFTHIWYNNKIFFKLSSVRNLSLSYPIISEFCTEPGKIMPCSVLNVQTVGQLKPMLWKNEISRDLSSRWVSDGYPIEHKHPRPTPWSKLHSMVIKEGSRFYASTEFYSESNMTCAFTLQPNLISIRIWVIFWDIALMQVRTTLHKIFLSC